MAQSPAALLVNMRSRRGTEWYDSATEEFKKAGLELSVSRTFDNPPGLIAAVKSEIAKSTPLIIVGGGDGTLGSVARLFIGSKSTLGVLPMGTGNAFARDLGIKADVASACETIAKGKDACVDVGRINDDYFLNVATVGLSTRIASQLTGATKKRFGRLVYLYAFCRAFTQLKPFQVTITCEGNKVSLEALQLVVGSGKYHAGPFPLAPDSSITDGLLNFYVVTGCNRWSLLKYALFLPGGMFTQLNEVDSVSMTSGAIDAMPRQKVTVDGEVKCYTPFKFGIEAGALRVRVPKEFESKESLKS